MKTGTERRAKRILIVDDHPMMRQGLAQLVEHEPDLEVCSEADTAAQALNLIAAPRAFNASGPRYSKALGDTGG